MDLICVYEVRNKVAQVAPSAFSAVLGEEGEYPRWENIASSGNKTGFRFSWLPTMSMLTSTNFGLASYGAILGIVMLFQNIGVATGPLMAAYMYDTMNTYQWAFTIFVALYAIAIPAILIVRRPKSLK